jgi:hypothetical protein
MQWTIRNIGSGPVVVGATYLDPGETREVTEAEARRLALARPDEIALVNPPGALEPGMAAETSGDGSGELLPPADTTDLPAPAKTAPIAPAKRGR